MKKINKLKIKIFADGADLRKISNLNNKRYISGFTTNPSLMKSSNVKNYETFSKKLLKIVKNKSISFEVTSDNIVEMEKQAYKINSWGKNVFIKIPFTNSKGKKNLKLIKKLSDNNIKLNITAIFTYKQVSEVYKVINKNSETYLSIFAGRIADTGVDPSIIIKQTVKLIKKTRKIKILWASCREVYSIFQADKLNCDIITIPYGLLSKLKLIGKNLHKYSVETSKDFFKDSKDIKFNL
jgi:transaldolase